MISPTNHLDRETPKICSVGRGPLAQATRDEVIARTASLTQGNQPGTPPTPPVNQQAATQPLPGQQLRILPTRDVFTPLPAAAEALAQIESFIAAKDDFCQARLSMVAKLPSQRTLADKSIDYQKLLRYALRLDAVQEHLRELSLPGSKGSGGAGGDRLKGPDSSACWSMMLAAPDPGAQPPAWQTLLARLSQARDALQQPDDWLPHEKRMLAQLTFELSVLHGYWEISARSLRLFSKLCATDPPPVRNPHPLRKEVIATWLRHCPRNCFAYVNLWEPALGGTVDKAIIWHNYRRVREKFPLAWRFQQMLTDNAKAGGTFCGQVADDLVAALQGSSSIGQPAAENRAVQLLCLGLRSRALRNSLHTSGARRHLCANGAMPCSMDAKAQGHSPSADRALVQKIADAAARADEAALAAAEHACRGRAHEPTIGIPLLCAFIGRAPAGKLAALLLQVQFDATNFDPPLARAVMCEASRNQDGSDALPQLKQHYLQFRPAIPEDLLQLFARDLQASQAVGPPSGARLSDAALCLAAARIKPFAKPTEPADGVRNHRRSRHPAVSFAIRP